MDDQEVVDSWRELFELYRFNADIVEPDGSVFPENKIGTIAPMLEGWARTAESGPALDWVCSEWLGLKPYSGVTIRVDGEDRPTWATSDPWESIGDPSLPVVELPAGSGDGPSTPSTPPKLSQDHAAAFVLLGAMPGHGLHPCIIYTPDKRMRWYCIEPGYQMATAGEHCTKAPSGPLAIARACAVLAARGIQRGNG